MNCKLLLLCLIVGVFEKQVLSAAIGKTGYISSMARFDL
jgi:hypothetical protein